MAGYRPTQIRKPSDETEFEKNCVILFKELLGDPNVSRVGTRGQAQNGVDIKGHRDGDPVRVVGIQCKLKVGNSKLTKREVEDEVKEALGFTPALKEYFIVTTSKNNTRLTQRALALMQEQAASGRQIHIEVWGWDTLEEKIGHYDAAKQAFDPGFSPALAAHDRKLDAVIEGQSNLATREDIAAIAKSLGNDGPDGPVRLPQRVADRELRDDYTRALRRRGFVRSNTQSELAELASRAIDGDLVLGTSALRADICERAARASAVPETRDVAVRFRDHAVKLDPSRDMFVVDAYLKDAAGDVDTALRDLRSRTDIEARSAFFMVLLRSRGTAIALDWARTEDLGPAALTPPAALNLVLRTIENGELEAALAFVSGLSPAHVDEIAALRLLRAQLTLAALLPADQKSALFQGLPVNPRLLQFAGGPGTDGQLRTALADIEALSGQTDELGIDYLSDHLSEFALWLRLEIADFREAARTQLVAEISNPASTLRRVRLALAYGVSFDRDALQRNLARRKELGGWSNAERFAAFLIAFHGGDEKIINAFFEAHRDDLYAHSDLSHGYLASIEIEALTRGGRVDEARLLLARYRGRHLTDDQVKDAEASIEAIVNGDEIEHNRRRYDETGSLSDLRVLVGGLRSKRDTRLLATYAPMLARATRTHEDFDIAVKSLYQERRDGDVVGLVDELPDLAGLDPEYDAIKGWSLYRLGRLMEARGIARTLLETRGDANDRELAVNTALETGDWGNLQAIIAREVARLDSFTAKDCVRLARLAFETNSPYVDRFRDAALAKAPDDPQVFLAAYMLATERGQEDREPRVKEWFQKAVELSGPNGPVQSASFREMIERTSGWRERTDAVGKMVRHAEIPMFMAARMLRRHLLDVTLGQALRNQDAPEGRLSYPVFAFSGARTPVELRSDMTAAFDVTALITLQHLGLLDQALAYFQKVVVAPGTLTLLFTERQFIRIQQPSQVAKAERIQALIAAGRLKTVPDGRGVRMAAAKEIGQDLDALLTAAQSHRGLVVRSSPVAKLGSYLDEAADMSPYSAILTDTHAVLGFLSSAGKIDAGKCQSAERYLRHVDKGWEAAPAIDVTSTIYLDELTVTYLDHVDLLDILTRSVAEVFVSEDVVEEARQTLRYAGQTNELLVAVERIRSSLVKEIESGKITFSTRRARGGDGDAADEDGENDDPDEVAPTLDLLSSLMGINVVITDDRCLNKLPDWLDASSQSVRCTSTLDVLAALRRGGQLDDAACRRARHTLRASGFYAMPAEADELLHWLVSAPLANGVVRETPELRAIRESLAICQINEAFIVPEEPWLVRLRLTICQAVRKAWIEAKDASVAEAHANWLLSILPDPLAWCPDPDNDAFWAVARQQAAVQAAIFMVFPEIKKDRQRSYFSWLETKLLAPMREHHPELWEVTLDVVKSYLGELWEAGDGDE